MNDLGILRDIKEQFKLDWWGHHGVRHWARVRRSGLLMANHWSARGADKKVISLFAIFHDACRDNEWHDPRHGERGAALAERMFPRLGITTLQMNMLTAACVIHTSLKKDKNLPLTIKICLDADRNDLPRVGIEPDFDYLHTGPVLKRAWRVQEQARAEQIYQRNRT